MDDYIQNFWNDYSFIHNTTKELYILSEELESDFSSFIQPIKEQRDSLEHIVRAYSRMCSVSLEDLNKEDQEYVKSNLSKALGHIFRAFFDCADILGIILREHLSTQLRNFSYSQIVQVWPKYETYRKQLIRMPKEFAKLRSSKDVAKKSDEIIAMVKQYKKCIDELFAIYDEFMEDIYPKLNA